MRAMGEGDDGDEGRVRLLSRRAESLRRQTAEASEAISPPQRRESDGVEAAASRARAALCEVTRSQLAGTGERPVPQERPPFGSASRGAGSGTEHTADVADVAELVLGILRLAADTALAGPDWPAHLRGNPAQSCESFLSDQASGQSVIEPREPGLLPRRAMPRTGARAYPRRQVRQPAQCVACLVGPTTRTSGGCP
jgi:hypothetical protein